MLRAVRHGFLLALALLLSCTTPRVTLEGQAVTDTTAQTAAVTLAAAAQALTVATDTIRLGYQAGTIPHAHGVYFLHHVYHPAVLAIRAGQAAVTAYLQTQNATTSDQLRTSMALVTYWLTEVQGLLAVQKGGGA